MVAVTNKTTVFFDRPGILKKLGKAERNYLAWSSRDVKQHQKRSIKRGVGTKANFKDLSDPDPKKRERAERAIKRQAAKVSQPGQAPLYRQNSYGVRDIRNVYDRSKNVGVAGMIKFNAGESIPQLLEFGGLVRRRVWKRTGLTAGKRARGPGVITKTLRYRARPSAGPALEKAAPRFPSIYARAFASA